MKVGEGSSSKETWQGLDASNSPIEKTRGPLDDLTKLFDSYCPPNTEKNVGNISERESAEGER